MTPTRRRFGQGLAGLGLAGLAGAGCDKAARPLLSADTQAADYPTVKALDFIGERLRERTDGRLDIRVYPGGQLGNERDTLEITMFGGLDLNRITLAPLNPVARATLAPSLPFIFRSTAHMRAAVDGAPGRTILESLEPYGLIGLCFYDSGARSFYTTRHPIRTPDDLAGLKIRVQNSDLYVAMVEALGANATPMGFGEVYQALVQGVIDGAENNWPSYDNTRHYEAAKYYSLTEHLMTPEVLVVSTHRWKKMSEPDREILTEAALQSVPYMRSLWDARTQKAREHVLAAGITLTDNIDKRPFQDLMKPVYERFVTPDLRPLVEAIQDTEAPDA